MSAICEYSFSTIPEVDNTYAKVKALEHINAQLLQSIKLQAINIKKLKLHNDQLLKGLLIQRAESEKLRKEKDLERLRSEFTIKILNEENQNLYSEVKKLRKLLSEDKSSSSSSSNSIKSPHSGRHLVVFIKKDHRSL